MIRTIFLDIDGVLADFTAGIHKVHNVPFDRTKWPYPNNDFYIDKYMNVDSEQFFVPCGEEFWENLEWTLDGKELLTVVEDSGIDIILLTSPCDTPGCLEGKRKWIKYNLPDYEHKVLYGVPKYACANENSLLIDDCNDNAYSFKKHGGKAIIVPRPWNDNYSLQGIAISYVMDLLKQISS